MYMKNLLLLLTAMVLMTSCSSDMRTSSEILAEKYNLSVEKFDQCVDEWGRSDERTYRRVAEYIGSKGIFGFFQPSCDGSIKEGFENYKTTYLSAPIYGKASEECKEWRNPKAASSLAKKNCLLEDFLLLHLEGGLTPEEISIKNALINAPYYAKIEQEKNRYRQQCAAKRHPCDNGNGRLDRLCMSQPAAWRDTGFFSCPREFRRQY